MSLSSNREAVAVLLAEAPVAAPGRSPWTDARRRFMRNRAAVASLVILAVIALVCLLGPLVLPYGFDPTDWDAMKLPPTWQNMHLWGTDESGRDLLVRCLIGGGESRVEGRPAAPAAEATGSRGGATAGVIGGGRPAPAGAGRPRGGRGPRPADDRVTGG